MRLLRISTVALVVALIAPCFYSAQAQAQEEADRKVAGGGIAVPGWQGKVDPSAASKGMSVNDSKFEQQGKALHLNSGPATVYWNPANMGKGDYTVKATFREPKQTNASHAHPFGLFIGGTNFSAAQPDLVYCVAYRTGNYLVRMFTGGQVKTLAPSTKNAAVHSSAPDAEVIQEVAWHVKGDKAECSINGTVVASYTKADLVGPGKLPSLDGVVGIRVTHNTDVIITDLALTK